MSNSDSIQQAADRHAAPLLAPKRKKGWSAKDVGSQLLGPAAIVIFLVIWEILVRVMEIPAFILSTPSQIAVVVYEDFVTGVVFRHFLITLEEVLVGFGIATIGGVLLGTVIGLVPWVNRTLYPMLLAVQTIPKIALAPLFLIWFGFGISSKIVTVAVIVFFPIMVNVIAGIQTVDPRRLLLMKALGATPFETYVKVRFPSMLPFLFAGLEVAIIFSVTGAIVAEFIGASVGLGSMIIQRQSTSYVAGVFSILFYLTVMGLTLNAILRWIGNYFCSWARVKES
jgi:NitT/TauT family transport system permease protein